MSALSDTDLTLLGPSESHRKSSSSSQESDKHDSFFELSLVDAFDRDNDAMASASSPFIKAEPNDNFDVNQFMQFNQSRQPHFNNQTAMNINPQSLSNGAMSQSFGQSNMASSFNMGNSGIADDELLDLQIDSNQQHNGGQFDFNQPMPQSFVNSNMGIGQQNPSMMSQTPHGDPIQSPFTHDFNYAQFRPAAGQQFGGHSMPQQAFRPHVQQMDRKISDTRSPGTPHTPGMHPQISTDVQHPGMQQMHHRQGSSIGNIGYESTPSGHSWNDGSPYNSPVDHLHHPQISEVLKNNTHHHHHHKIGTSLPAKMEGGSGPAFQSQEAKRRRRRESHNLVERRRRDNINERIHDLGGLVPQHRLEDEKVRKHLQTNAPLSPSIANAGLSPPAATSLLAGPQCKRATGSGTITTGLPLEDKDKGPNKGDILNGSVAWTRDLMWYMQLKLRQEEQAKQQIAQLGGVWPFEQTEDEKRMLHEITEVLNKHATAGGFPGYSRAPGSGLRVPGFTNVAGDPINGDAQIGPDGRSSVSPGFQPGGNGGMSAGSAQAQQNVFWAEDFKEEDEYNMEV